ncbi:cell surface glycoprotein CD200 receptor 1-A isoform X2 [Megalops cyprinoides]|uniref:cell surface glycoprotein CD200 receptor 1-A isoform X2 n=1 Tax=Megalops cyprinoides TaxID=118141 RepID=UPI0018648280|nr:cell surface glycoprotein CD200 receptor 1-A isoform X2 [Megalops cyprinoides]
MANLWILTSVCLLALSVTCKATNEYRSEYHGLGKSVNLTCMNKTWSDMLYIIWKLNMRGTNCRITAGIDEAAHDTCKDGKVLRNTTTGQSYLHVPNFKNEDEGIYSCETAFLGSSYAVQINVSAFVPPQISTRLDIRDGKREAVCSAAGGKPAASVSWRNTWNCNVTQSSRQNSDGSFTVESRFILPDPVDADNLSCIITHPSWGERLGILLTSDQREPRLFQWIIVALGSISFAVAVLAGLYITRKHLGKLRNCCKSKISASPPPKTPQPQDVEEVEPYASYVQRVNSIYNSSAELCNA